MSSVQMIYGYLVEGGPDGLIKIEGQPPMSLDAAREFFMRIHDKKARPKVGGKTQKELIEEELQKAMNDGIHIKELAVKKYRLKRQ